MQFIDAAPSGLLSLKLGVQASFKEGNTGKSLVLLGNARLQRGNSLILCMCLVVDSYKMERHGATYSKSHG
jgi:hypothetical protein